MKLSKILENVETITKDYEDVEITGVTIDSREVKDGFLFICFEGTKFDGHTYIKDAIANGAKAIIVQKDVENLPGVEFIKTTSGRENIARIACNFYGNPSKEFKLIGITGTKGKTTTTYMIKSILEAHGLKVGLIGTIEIIVGNNKLSVSHNTTPDAVELQKYFRMMADEGVDAVVMEVSSHALALDRVLYSDFDIGVFTNLSQDHLDYHKTFEEYFTAKKKLFNLTKLAIVNIDSDYGKRVITETPCPKKTYAIDSSADITATNINIHPRNVIFDVEVGSEKHSGMVVKIPGKFSVYNALSAISVTKELGCSFDEMQKGFDKLNVPGRSEIVDINRDFTVMVDYAHSPESLKSILETTKEYAKGRVISVFGCGGDRDRTKRPIIGKISGEIADFTIITSDNPRTEEPLSIIHEIEEGIKETGKGYITIEDRASAIFYALKIAKKDDVIVIAGKGHEPYQILKNETIHFDDREQVVIQNEKLNK